MFLEDKTEPGQEQDQNQVQTPATEIDENDIFGFDKDKLAEDEDDDMDYSSFEDGSDDIKPLNTDSEEEEEEEEEEDDDDLFKTEEEEEQEEEFTDAELASFNKKLGTDFKDAQELKSFLNKDEKPAAQDETKEEDELKEAEEKIALYEGFIAMDDKSLMLEQYRTISRNSKDPEIASLSDEEKDEWAEEQLEEIIENKTLTLHAKALRDDIKTKGLTPFQQKKQAIEQARTQKQQEAQKEEREKYENVLAGIYHSKNFFGLTPDKQTIKQVYKKITSGEFHKSLEDPKYLAELAMMAELRDDISKKSSGLTYNDGIGSVLEEFKAKKNRSGDGNPIIKAQSRGTAGGGDRNHGIAASLVK